MPDPIMADGLLPTRCTLCGRNHLAIADKMLASLRAFGATEEEIAAVVAEENAFRAQQGESKDERRKRMTRERVAKLRARRRAGTPLPQDL